MPWAAVQLKPGVDTQLTLAANQAGVSQSQLIRYKEGLIQVYGGWATYTAVTIGSTVRDLHAWQDVAGAQHLFVGATANAIVLTSGSGQDITPQTTITNSAVNVAVTAGSSLAQITDAGANVSTYNTVYFNTPVSVGGWIFNGAYQITSGGGSPYTIMLSSQSAATASPGVVPSFTTTAGSQVVSVTLPNHGFQAIPGLFQQFIATTTVGGATIQGKYQIASVVSPNVFTINLPQAAPSGATASMNGGLMQLQYYVTLGPTVPGSGFGLGGGFGAGGFGTGTPGVGTPGTPITATDWTSDNFGDVLLACPENGPVYAWAASFGFQNFQVVNTAPFFNGGLFVSMPQQILVCWRSTQSTGVQDPLIVRWSNAGDYTNFVVSNLTTAGSFHIPTGSIIRGGMQCPVFGLISTDIDVWTMTYVGGTIIFNFNRVGTGCGWLSSHACGVLAGNPYWIGTNNFYMLAQQGVTPMPCTVWDFVFQNLSPVDANRKKTRVAVSSGFNEVAWFFCSANATEPDSYAKVHIEGQEFEWDYGSLIRTAWIDISVLGMPIGADTNGTLWQHETGNSITGAALPVFRSGWFTIAEGQDLPFIDMIIPDFIWGLYSGAKDASVVITFFGTDALGATPYTYGPFFVTQATPYINCRIRNKFLSVQVQSNLSAEFWRLGRVRFRMASSGRR